MRNWVVRSKENSEECRNDRWQTDTMKQINNEI